MKVRHGKTSMSLKSQVVRVASAGWAEVAGVGEGGGILSEGGLGGSLREA